MCRVSATVRSRRLPDGGLPGRSEHTFALLTTSRPYNTCPRKIFVHEIGNKGLSLFFFLKKAYFYKTYSYLIIHTQNYDCFHTEKVKREK